MNTALPRLLVLAAALLAAVPAGAKIAFTGYGDFQMTAHGRGRIAGPPALLTSLGVSDTETRSRGGRLNAVGFFAITEIAPGLTAETDISYRDVDFRDSRVQLQYADIRWDFAPGWELRGGKITLPFGYYNEKRFYPFRRASISAPIFQSGILGLPIADAGGALERELEAGPVAVRAAAFAVNGYGPLTAGSTSTFRSGSLPGGLVIANNLSAGNRNDELAAGARVSLRPAGRDDFEAGGTYYRGDWDAKADKLLQIWNAHARAVWAGFDLLAEGLWMRVEGDEGFAASLGDRNWRTRGFFAELQYGGFAWRGKPVVPWARFETYRTIPDANVFGREKLDAYAAGLAFHAHPNVALKIEGLHLDYEIPFAPRGIVELGFDSVTIGITATY